MRIIAFIEDPRVVRAILLHLLLWDEARPPPATLAAPGVKWSKRIRNQPRTTKPSAVPTAVRTMVLAILRWVRRIQVNRWRFLFDGRRRVLPGALQRQQLVRGRVFQEPAC